MSDNSAKEHNLQKQSCDSERKLELLEYKKKKEQEVQVVQNITEKQVNNIKEMYGSLLQKVCGKRKSGHSGLPVCL